jgi:hypothetical protein
MHVWHFLILFAREIALFAFVELVLVFSYQGWAYVHARDRAAMQTPREGMPRRGRRPRAICPYGPLARDTTDSDPYLFIH